MDNGLGVFTSKCTETNAPGIGGAHGKNSGWPSSSTPLKRLQIGFVPKSGRLLPTRTTIVAGLLSPEMIFIEKKVDAWVWSSMNFNCYKLLSDVFKFGRRNCRTRLIVCSASSWRLTNCTVNAQMSFDYGDVIHTIYLIPHHIKWSDVLKMKNHLRSYSDNPNKCYRMIIKEDENQQFILMI